MRADLCSPGLMVYMPDASAETKLEQLHWISTESTETPGHPSKGIGLSSLKATLSNPASKNQTLSVTLIIPAEVVVIAAVIVPSDKPKHIRAAAPNLLEESIASDTEQLHFVYGTRSASGQVPLAAVDREWFAAKLAAIEDSGVQCDVVFIDALLLHCEPGALTLVIDGQRALLRWGQNSAGSIELTALTPLLQVILRVTPIARINLCTVGRLDTIAASFLENELPPLLNKYPLIIEEKTFDGSIFELLTAQLSGAARAPIDLRQGEFCAPQRNNAVWHRWRPVAFVAAGLLAAQLLLNLATGAVLQHRAQSAHAEAETLYRELFPNDRRLVNLQQQLQNQLGSLPGNNTHTFLELFGELAREIQKAPGTPPIQLRAISYDTAGGVLQVDMNIADVQALDDLQKRLSIDRLHAKVLSAAAADEGGGITGRLSVSEK